MPKAGQGGLLSLPLAFYMCVCKGREVPEQSHTTKYLAANENKFSLTKVVLTEKNITVIPHRIVHFYAWRDNDLRTVLKHSTFNDFNFKHLHLKRDIICPWQNIWAAVHSHFKLNEKNEFLV